MPDGRWPTREDLEDLKRQGTVFTSPSSIRFFCVAGIFGVLIGCWSWMPHPIVPETLDDIPSYLRAVGRVGAALSAACLSIGFLVSLALNGFVVSASVLTSRRRVRQRPGALAAIVCLVLGVSSGGLLASEFAGDLFLLLRVDDLDGIKRAAGALGLALSNTMIVGGLVVAILIAGVARLWFLFENRVDLRSREQ